MKNPGVMPSAMPRRSARWRIEGFAQWWALEDGKPSFENRKEDVRFEDVLQWD